MAKDYDRKKEPPEWAIKEACRQCGWSYASFLPFKGWERPLQALAYHIWKYEEPPVDPMIVVMREAIARYVENRGFQETAVKIRNAEFDQHITIALNYLRERGALVEHMPS